MLLMDLASGTLAIRQELITYPNVYSICLGMNIANQTLFIDMTRILWALNIEQAIDIQGNPIVPSKIDCVDEGLVVCVISLSTMISSNLLLFQETCPIQM